MTQQHIHSLSVDFLFFNSKMMQPPILTRQEATLWLKVSAHSTLVMNFNSQEYIPICRHSDSQQTLIRHNYLNPGNQRLRRIHHSRTSATSLHIIWPKPISERFRSLALSISELRRGSQNSKVAHLTPSHVPLTQFCTLLSW